MLISPTGVRAVDPDGEVAVARAAAARGITDGPVVLRQQARRRVVAANPKTLFQIYWLGGRDAIAERVEQARAAGAVGLIVTTDWVSPTAGTGATPRSPSRWTCAPS